MENSPDTVQINIDADNLTGDHNPPSNPHVTPSPQAEVKKDEISTKSDTESLVTCQIDHCNLNIPSDRYDRHVFISHPKKEQKPKHAGGRPCGYCDRANEIIKITREYIESGKAEKPRMLYINELAMKLGGYRDIIIEWKNKKTIDGNLEHPEFADMIKQLESMQELRLQQRLMGRYNPTGAIFLLKTKHKYIETEKQILAGDKSEAIQIEFVSERKLTDLQEQ